MFSSRIVNTTNIIKKFNRSLVPSPNKENHSSFHADNWVGKPFRLPVIDDLLALLVF